MPIQAGKLRHRIKIQRSTRNVDAQGGTDEPTWTDLYPCWARVEPFAGREYTDDRAIVSELTHRITVRKHADFTIVPEDRAEWEGRIFHFDSVLNDEEIGEFLVLLCRETGV